MAGTALLHGTGHTLRKPLLGGEPLLEPLQFRGKLRGQ
jgi:hypothetical protein